MGSEREIVGVGRHGGIKKVVGQCSSAGHLTSLFLRADLLSGPPVKIDFSMRSF